MVRILSIGLLKSALSFCLFFAVSQAAYAGTSSSVTKLNIIPAASLTKTQDLDFGRVLAGTAVGNVRINARTGIRSRTGAVVLVGTTSSRAAFLASGAAGLTVRFSIGANTIFLNRVGGGASVRLNTFRISTGATAPQSLPRNFVLPTSGSQTYFIGGNLRVAANQAAGIYQGTFNLTMNYQ